MLRAVYTLAHGQILSIAQNTALFSILGTTYGGDGRSTFGLPDTRGRALIGWGNGPGLTNYPLGSRGGTESVILSEAQLPSHSHTASTLMSGDIDIDGVIDLHAFSGKSNTKSPAGNALSGTKYATETPDVAMSPDSISFSFVAENNPDGFDNSIECWWESVSRKSHAIYRNNLGHCASGHLSIEKLKTC
ncbi:tail fiber protein [Vibrio sp. M60_M31a]